jgi:hypothetical protein
MAATTVAKEGERRELRFKLIMVLVYDHYTENILAAAREAGATSAAVVRGEGMHSKNVFFGLEIASHRTYSCSWFSSSYAARY